MELEKNEISKFCQVITEINRISKYLEKERKIHNSDKPNRWRGDGKNSFEDNYNEVKELQEFQEKFMFYFNELYATVQIK